MTGSAKRQAPLDCPCGGAAPGRPPAAPAPRFAACCSPYLDGRTLAPSALELMRSRYSAYVLGHTDYLRATWDPATCPADLDADPNAPMRRVGSACKSSASSNETRVMPSLNSWRATRAAGAVIACTK